MMNFLQQIVDGIRDFFTFIGHVITFVIKMVQDLVYTVQVVTDAVGKVPQYLSFLPATVLTLLTGAFTIVIVYKIVGRD